MSGGMHHLQPRGVTVRVLKRIDLPEDLLEVVGSYVGKVVLRIVPSGELEPFLRLQIERSFMSSITKKIIQFRDSLLPSVKDYHVAVCRGVDNEIDMLEFKRLRVQFSHVKRIQERQERRMREWHTECKYDPEKCYCGYCHGCSIYDSQKCLNDPEKCQTGSCVVCYNQSLLFDQ